MIETLTHLIIQLIKTAGYPGVFLLMTLESALIPIPSEATMVFAGSLIRTGAFNFWALVAAGTLGNLVGSLATYWLGYLGENYILKFIRNYGRYVFIREKEYLHAKNLFNRWGEPLVFVSRILPAVRTYISLPAGLVRMNLKKFVVYTTVGSLLWTAALTYLGLILGANWQAVTPFFHLFDILIVISVIGLAGYWAVKKFRGTV